MVLELGYEDGASRGTSLLPIFESRGLIEEDGVSIEVSLLSNFNNGSFGMEENLAIWWGLFYFRKFRGCLAGWTASF